MDDLGRKLPRPAVAVIAVGAFVTVVLIFVIVIGALDSDEDGCGQWGPQDEIACHQLTATALAGH